MNQLRSYVRGVRFGLVNGFESSPKGMILDKILLGSIFPGATVVIS